MARKLTPQFVLGLCLMLGATACVGGAKLREDAKLIESKIATAKERGAYRCAPEQLAQAETNLEFLSYELDEGNYARASYHHRAALENVNRAIELTDPNECADKRVLIVTPTDRDGDGIPDDVDKCPDEPEDKDGFQDEDGCPDPDNDQDGVPDIIDRCPNEPGPASNQGCPVSDRDGDGIADDVDKCPDQPEDFDGFQDQDGCPDLDNDNDGVPDAIDRCPNDPGPAANQGCPLTDRDGDGVTDDIDACPDEPGPASNHGCPIRDRDGDGVPDDVDQCPDVPGPPPTGCPKKVLVVVTDKAIQIKQQIQFATNKAVIRGAISFEILDQVASVLKSHAAIRVVIEGHTDSVGAAAYNLRLSDARAHSVRQALIERGVEPDRMEAIGYGQSRPIASNRTAKGKAANRRVEFNIVQPPAPGAAPAPAGSPAPASGAAPAPAPPPVPPPAPGH